MKEKVIAHIASAITVFSMQQNTSQLPKNLEAKVSIDLIDDIFSYVSGTHFDT